MKDSFNKKVKNAMMAVCSGILIVQFVYAVVWMLYNINGVQDFNETMKYLEVANSLKGDGWHLLGYPVFLKLFMSLAQIFGNNYVIFIYVAQLAISYVCYAYGCKVIAQLFYRKKIKFCKVVLPTIYILTVPIVWQMQFALLPDALCLALLVLASALMTECIQNYQNPGIKKASALGCVIILLGILQRHYFYAALLMLLFGAVIVLIRTIKKRIKKVKNYIIIAAVCLSIGIMPMMVNALNQIRLSEDADVTYTIELDLWDRFVYPNVVFDYPYYTQEIKSALTEETSVDGSEYREYYITRIASEIQQNAGTDAKRIYGEMVRIGFAVHRGDIISQTVKESIAYILIPLAMEKYMYHNANSLYGYNVTRMYEQCPRVTMDYLHVGMNGLLVVCVLGAVATLTDLFTKRQKIRRMISLIGYYFLIIVCGTLPIMLFSIAKFDYRTGLFAIYIYGAISLLNIFKTFINKEPCDIIENTPLY